MKVMQAILHVKKFSCNLLHAFAGFEWLIFLSEYGAMGSFARKLFFGADDKIKHKAGCTATKNG